MTRESAEDLKKKKKKQQDRTQTSIGISPKYLL
jgi:hypothetical protein